MLVLLIWMLQWFAGPSPVQRYELRGKAQGTTWSVVYYARDSSVTKKQCDSVLASLDSSLSIYKPYSRINALNAAARKYHPDHHLGYVLQKGLFIARQSGGAFDPVLLALVNAWGFGVQRHSQPPDTATVRRLLACSGYRNLRFRGKQVVKSRPCVQVDVNGIAQGYSVDVLAAFIQNRGVHDYLVEIGGEIRVNGRKQPSGAPFTVGVESPEAETSLGAPLQRTLYLVSGALTTSGNYRRYYLHGDKAIPHLIDPRTGFTVSNELVSVTVWAADAITADAWDNALMVLGLDESLQLLAKHPELAAHFIYRKKDGTVADTATANFQYLFTPPPALP